MLVENTRSSLCGDMRNEASKTRSLDIAFVVTPDLLKGLEVILGETSDTLEYTVKFSDGTSVHYNKIDDVIGQPIPTNGLLSP